MPKRVRSEKLYLGIDPGESGGLAVVSNNRDRELYYTSMPTTEWDIWKWISDANSVNTPDGPLRIQDCCIEKVHAFPGQGVTSMFTFGVGYGGLRMALISAQIPFQEVQPRTWQKHFGISPRKKAEAKPAFKERLRGKCQQLFPSLDVWNNTLGIQRSVCDAILIAEYVRRTSK